MVGGPPESRLAWRLSPAISVAVRRPFLASALQNLKYGTKNTRSGEFWASSLECIPSLLTRLALPSLFHIAALSSPQRLNFEAEMALARRSCRLCWRGNPLV